ncbi:MAG TPA: transporter [Actinomycetota bacterium]
MTWLVWRQHRKQLLFGVVALLVLGVFFVGTGGPIHDRFERLGLPDCLPQTIDATVVAELFGDAASVDDATAAITRCAQTARAFLSDYQIVFEVGGLLLFLPMLAGMFWGAPLVARELEHGTHRLVWTQGTSRLRWAATKIGLVSAAVLVMTAVFAGMLTWWITPVIQTSGQRFDFGVFDIHGIVVFGYTIFALALGVFAGAVTGRLLTAMATTAVAFLATRLVVMLAARPNFLPTETVSVRLDPARAERWNLLHGDWILSRQDPPGCAKGATDCVDTLTMQIHPAHHFWTFQAIETAIFVALAICLVLATIYWIRRRIA